MARSYLYLQANTIPSWKDFSFANLDVLLLDLADYLKMLEDKDVYNRFEEGQTAVYLVIKDYDFNQTFHALKDVDIRLIKGFAVRHATKQAMTYLSLKLREIEQQHRLPFGVLSILAFIEDAKGVLEATKIGNYQRVIGLCYQDDSENDMFLKDVLLSAFSTNKDFIYVSQDASLLTAEFYEAKRLGFDGILTEHPKQVTHIKEAYQATENEINHAAEVIRIVEESTVKNRKKLFVNNVRITPGKVKQALLILENEDLLDSVTTKQIRITKNKIYVMPKKEMKIHKFYTIGEEVGNAISHGVGILLGLISIVLLTLKGIKIDNLHMLSYLVFSLSAVLLYTMSTLYHALPLGSKAKQVFQKLDHMTIYALIAGTYTPFTLLAIGGELGVILCIILWIAAFFGMFMNLFFFKRFRWLHMSLYVIMGWVAIFFIPQIITNLSTMGIVFLFSGGIMYTLGILFYALKLFKFTHMIWHFFVFFGTLLHFFAIYYYL